MKPMNVARKFGAKAAVVLTGLAVGVANAALDVSATSTEISGGKAAATELGLAALGVIGLIGLLVWLRRPVR